MASFGLTEQEIEVISAVVQGLTMKEIAQQLRMDREWPASVHQQIPCCLCNSPT
jgi:FixJ family two-component response regulator